MFLEFLRSVVVVLFSGFTLRCIGRPIRSSCRLAGWSSWRTRGSSGSPARKPRRRVHWRPVLGSPSSVLASRSHTFGSAAAAAAAVAACSCCSCCCSSPSSTAGADSRGRQSWWSGERQIQSWLRGAARNVLPPFQSRSQNPLLEPGMPMQVCTWKREPSQGRGRKACGRSVAEQGTGAGAAKSSLQPKLTRLVLNQTFKYHVTFICGSQLTHWACFWAGIEAFILPSTPQIKRKLAFSSIHELAQEISDDLKSVLQFLRWRIHLAFCQNNSFCETHV